MMTKVKIRRLKPTIKYCGSLCQQNHGEALEGHGLVEWDLSTLQFKDVDIVNDYGYCTLEIEDGEILNWTDSIPDRPRIRARFKNTDIARRKEIEAEVRAKRNVAEWVVQSMDRFSSKNSLSFQKHLKNIRDVEYQNSLILEFLVNKDISNPVLEQIKNINREVNTKLKDEVLVRGVIWKPLKFTFSNMFSYGEDNTLDFSNLEGVYGIFAPNAHGKSTLFDSLCFCLFDKCSKTIRAADVLNRSKDYFECQLDFSLNDKKYTIYKKGTKDKKGHVKVDIDFYTIKEDGEVVSLNGERRDATNKSIRDYVGTYDDFILTALSIQNESANFIDKSQVERRDLLAQFLDIRVFESLFYIANEEIKETKTLVESLEKQDSGSKLGEAQRDLLELEAELEVLQKKVSEQEELREKGLQVKEVFIKSLKNIEKLPQEADVLSKLDQVKEEISRMQVNFQDLTVLQELKTQTAQIKQELRDLGSETTIQSGVLALETAEKAHATVVNDLKIIESKINSRKTEVTALELHEYDPNCSFCVKHPVVESGNRAKKQLEELLVELSQKNDEKLQLEQKILDYTPNRQKLRLHQTRTNQLVDAENKILLEKQKKENLHKDIQLKNKDIEKLNEILDKIKESAQSIEENKAIQEKINMCDQRLAEIKRAITTLNEEVLVLTRKIAAKNFVVEECNKNLAQLKELTTKYEAYKYYLESVKSTGIPYRLIEMALPEIQQEVNNILNQVVDFEVTLESGGQNNIYAFITYGHEKYWSLEGASGMERFMSSLAIRTALITNTTLPKPNFMCIDEGFGVLDSSNFGNVSALFDSFKSKFEFIICISHLENMKDIVDDRIEIVKRDSFSVIDYSL